MTLYSSSSNRAVRKLNCYVVIVQNKTVLCAVFWLLSNHGLSHRIAISRIIMIFKNAREAWHVIYRTILLFICLFFFFLGKTLFPYAKYYILAIRTFYWYIYDEWFSWLSVSVERKISYHLYKQQHCCQMTMKIWIIHFTISIVFDVDMFIHHYSLQN